MIKALYTSILFFFCVMFCADCFAGIDPSEGKMTLPIVAGNSFTIKDNKFENSAVVWTDFTNKTVKNAVTLRVVDDVYIGYAFTYKVNINIDFYNVANSSTIAYSETASLTVSYDPATGTVVKNVDTYNTVNTGYKMKITVVSVQAVQGVAPSQAMISLSASIMVDRTYKFQPDYDLLMTAGNITDNKLDLTWAFTQGPVINPGAEEYDVEWTYINDGNPDYTAVSNNYTGAAGDITAALTRVFLNNASRVTVGVNNYSLPVVSNDTYLLVRVRQAQYLNDIRITGKWNYKATIAGVANKFGIWAPTWHEAKMNWQYAATLAEGGNRKDVTTYFDGTLRNRQVVTINNSDNVPVAQENIYDDAGRVTANILPAPFTGTASLKFNGAFNLSDISGKPYSFSALNLGSNCEITPQPLKTTSGASRYYSASNDFLTLPTTDSRYRNYNKFIPDAQKFPIAVTQYTNDNTGRVRVQGGVGLALQPGTAAPGEKSKTTKYYYGKPEQWELDRLFGNDVGYAEHYAKNMVIDPNGQVSISYMNATGKTIATALAGTPPASLDGLPSSVDPNPVTTTVHILKPEQFVFNPSELKISASTTYLATSIGTGDLSFDIQKLIDLYPGGTQQICSNCYYNMTIRIYDDCNTLVKQTSAPVQIGSSTSNCSDNLKYTGTLTGIPFGKPGEYFVTVDFAFDNKVIDAYVDNFESQAKRNNYLTSQFNFIMSGYLNNLDISGCYKDCHTCSTMLGDQATFVQMLKDKMLSLDIDPASVASTVFNDWASGKYTALKQQCDALQSTCDYSPCDDVMKQMMADVSPGGQYALFKTDGTPLEPTVNVITKVVGGIPNYRQTGKFPVKPNTDPDYQSELIVRDNGQATSPYDAGFGTLDFIRYWKPAWAQKFLADHPESCKLDFCNLVSAYKNWDLKARDVDKTSDLYKLKKSSLPAPVYAATNVDNWLLLHDPFFESTQGAPYKAQMQADLENYSFNVLNIPATYNGKSIVVKGLLKYVDYTLYCADAKGTTNGALSDDNWTNCQPQDNCRVQDREWKNYWNFYSSLKQKYYELAQNQYCNLNSTACAIGTPVSFKFPGQCPTKNDFDIQDDVNPGTDSISRNVVISYKGGAVSSSLNLSIYTPNGIITGGLNFSAGQSRKTILVNRSFPVSSLGINSIDCTAGSNQNYDMAGYTVRVFNGGYSSSPCDYGLTNIQLVNQSGQLVNATSAITVNLSFSETDYHFDPNTNDPIAGQPYTFDRSFTIPAGQSKSDDYTYPVAVEIHCGNQSVSYSCAGSISNANGASFDSGCAPPPATDPCQAYAGKTSRFPTYQSPVLLGNSLAEVATLQQQGKLAIQQQATDICNTNADTWKDILAPGVQALHPSTYNTELNNLKARMIAICVQGADETHPYGVSALKSGDKIAGNNDTDFGSAIKGAIGIAKFTPAINPWLIESPAPYSPAQQSIAPTVSNTNVAICNILQQAKADAATAGLPLYDYFVATYKSAMTITRPQLDVLQKSCDQCRFIMTEDVTLPVFLDPNNKGVITKTDFDNAKTDLLNNFQSATALQADPNYPFIFTTFMNNRFGFVLTYADYTTYGTASQANVNLKLCNKTPFGFVKVDLNACAKQSLEIAVNSGKRDYALYINAEREKFRADYINTCKLASANANLSTMQNIYHYTLYYYDQADNLVRTVPPEGVHLLTPDKLTWVDEARVTNADDGIAGLDAYRSSIIENGKTAALTNLSTYLSAAGSSRAIEMWSYNPGTGVNQFIEETPDKQYLFQVSIGSNRLNVDVYKTTETVVNNVSSLAFTKSNNFSANITSLSPLNPWAHVVVQSTDFLNGTLNVYLNGTKLTASTPVVGNSSWTILPGGATITYPDNISMLKHLRYYTRFLTTTEILANAKQATFVPYSGAGITWYRFNKPAAGGPTTLGGTSTDETRIVTVFPEHTLVTNYTQNSHNQTLTKQSPDGGATNYWYDLLGRLVVSQDAKQILTNDYSYTSYDALGRILELGQKKYTGSTIGIADYLSDGVKNTFFLSGTNSQITRTLYDQSAYDAATALGSNAGVVSLPEQSNLRKRISATTYSDTQSGPVLRATYYNYDIDGNAKTVWQQIDGLTDAIAANLKRFDYQFDLISGKVNFASYQAGKNDQFYYAYKYDAENSMISARSGTLALLNSSTGSMIFRANERMDASYRYYLHGPVARLELGDSYGKAQGMDYAYTLQGWPKGVNSAAVLPGRDMGTDGLANGSVASSYPKDAFGYSLYYYGPTSASPDYQPVVPASNAFENVTLDSFRPLYNGNIAASSMNLPQIADPWHFYGYKYDQLNRLLNTNVWTATGTPTGLGSVTPITGGAYQEAFTYDANGNIKTVNRKGTGGTLMDDFTYKYDQDGNGNLVNNRLRAIRDAANSGSFTDDIDDQVDNNYTYDAIGNLKTDQQALITATGNDGIQWSVYGKILSIPGGNPITYTYDASAKRVSKTTGSSNTTWYVRDASGNTIAVYDNIKGTGEVNGINWREQQLYGSNRLGIWKPNVNNIAAITPAAALTAVQKIWDSQGVRQYELSNHLGNVMATVTDRRIQHSSNSTAIDYYLPDISTEQEYYAFGALMSGRSLNASKYRYGFNGKENDSDIGKGPANQQDYGMRIYDPRAGRFLSVDPLAPKYPELTPYQFASNTPLQANDLDGEEAKNMIDGSIMHSPTQDELNKQKNNNISFWKDQFLYEKLYPFKNLIDENPNIRRQAMADASGGDVNMDYWEVRGTLPKGWTASQVYNQIRKNLDSYMNYSITTVGTQDPAMKKLWESGDPTGAVMVFYPYAMDHSGVITSKSTSDSWVFTPVWTATDWRHPLAGHREFGLTDNKDGTFTFYTRAIDRMWTPQDAYYNYNGLIPLGGVLSLGNRNVFFNDDAAKTWGGLMNNIVKFIISIGGTAKRTTSFNKQVPWDSISGN